MINKILAQIAQLKYLSHWIILFADVAISTIATAITIFLLQTVAHRPMSINIGVKIVLLASIASLIAFLAMRTYHIVIRHTTLKEQWKIGVAVLIKVSLVWGVAMYIFSDVSQFVILGSICDAMITVFMLISMRIVALVAYDTIKYRILRNRENKTNVLVYGINNRSVAMAERVKASKEYNFIGFYNFGKEYKSYRLADSSVYYFCNKRDFSIIIEKYNVNGIIFSDYKLAQLEQDRLLHYCSEEGVKILIGQNASEMDKDKPFAGSIRQIKIEDLLGRDEINVNMELIDENFRNRTILITGAAGSIGSELCTQLAQIDIKHLILFDAAETPMHNLRLRLESLYPTLKFTPVIGDVRDKQRLEGVFMKYHPEVVFHAAAYKHVPLMEENPTEAIDVNIIGTRNLADIAASNGVEKMIMISTDKAVNPTNIMGASKRIAEMYVQGLGLAISKGGGDSVSRTKFVTTRFGNVLGSNGSVIPRFREQIEKGGPITVTHPDITRFFMTIPEACRLVMEAATMGSSNEIFVFEMGEPVKIAEMARRMIELAGYKPDQDIAICYTGLRPGEKLYEEVLSNMENTIPTQHKKILIAKVRDIQHSEINSVIDKLEMFVDNLDIESAVRTMKDIVPEFISNNSEFSKFDTHAVENSDSTPLSTLNKDNLGS